MGNCCRRESSILVVAGVHRRSLPSKTYLDMKHSDEEVDENDNVYRTDQWRRKGETENGASSSSSSSCCLREVKIKMTKKELKELIGWLNMADSSLEQVMCRMGNVISNQGDEEDGGRVVHLRQQRSWRPSLQSIPEEKYETIIWTRPTRL